jgi:hypothetical protein
MRSRAGHVEGFDRWPGRNSSVRLASGGQDLIALAFLMQAAFWAPFNGWHFNSAV